MKVLVVDDNELIREMLSEILIDSGYQVETACSGEQALQKLRSGSFRLVVLDWVMPGLSGIDVCREIRSHFSGRYVYVIVLTSRDGTGDIVKALDAGADDFIAKPCEPEELCVRLRVGERMLTLESRDVTILALAKIAESRDKETGAHLERIREYCRVLAMDLSNQREYQSEIDGNYVEMIYATSPLHDIGKVGVPDSILLKPGKLTKEEFEQMKTHTLVGAQSLEATLEAYPEARYLQMARDIAVTHHEKWDGSGYPYGLSGEDIPLCGRIVALADVYDALTTERCYKPAYSHEEARFRIVNESGSHFDPAIVDAFIRHEERFAQIRKTFDDGATPASELLPSGDKIGSDLLVRAEVESSSKS